VGGGRTTMAAPASSCTAVTSKAVEEQLRFKGSFLVPLRITWLLVMPPGMPLLSGLLFMLPLASPDALKTGTSLLRLLLAPAPDADAPAASGPQSAQVAAWVEEWVRALASGPLTRAAPLARPQVPAMLGGLLQQQQQAAGAGAEGGATAGPAPGPRWLTPLAEATALAAEARSGGGGGAAEASDDENTENENPNARRARGRGAGRGAKTASARAAEEEEAAAAAAAQPLAAEDLPALAGYFVQAARLKKVSGAGFGGEGPGRRLGPSRPSSKVEVRGGGHEASGQEKPRALAGEFARRRNRSVEGL
jgi:hypothetical protein